MNDSEEARLRELSRKAFEGAITDEEFAELAQLSRVKQKLREGRATLVVGLRETLQSQSITIHELFTAAEIAAAVPQSGALGQGVRRAGPAIPAPESGAARAWKRRVSGPVLIEIPKYRPGGVPCQYFRGQILSYYVSKNWKLLDDGQLEANLERHFTAQGHRYFATPEGQVELARLVNYIRTHDIKPHLR